MGVEVGVGEFQNAVAVVHQAGDDQAAGLAGGAGAISGAGQRADLAIAVVQAGGAQGQVCVALDDAVVDQGAAQGHVDDLATDLAVAGVAEAVAYKGDVTQRIKAAAGVIERAVADVGTAGTGVDAPAVVAQQAADVEGEVGLRLQGALAIVEASGVELYAAALAGNQAVGAVVQGIFDCGAQRAIGG